MPTPFGLLPDEVPADPGLEHALNHKERAIAALVSQFRDKPRLAKLIEIYTRPFQELEDVFWQLYTERRINVATGVHLELIGKILLEPRGGLSDADYRAVLRAKARVLFSNGTGPNLIQIAMLFLESTLFTYEEFYPASVEMRITDANAASRVRLLARLLKRAKSGGVRIDVVDATGDRFTYGTGGTFTGFGYGEAPYGGII